MSTALRTARSSTLPATLPATGWAFVALYTLAYIGAWLALLTPIMVTLALRVQELAQDHAANALSGVLSVGALFALFGNPLFGRLSDRTTSRMGMRRPWLIGGALGGALSLWMVATAPSIAWVLLGWCLVQLSFNAVLAPLAALLPDQVPESHRGTVAGIISITTALGQSSGTGLTQLVSGSMMAMFLVPGLIGVAAILLLAVFLSDRRLTSAQREPLRWDDFLGALWVNPRRHPAFACICSGRFFMMMGMTLMMAYQPFYLQSQLGVPTRDVTDIVFHSTLVQCGVSMLAGLATGRLSDMMGRRKPFVIGAALVYGAGALLIAVAHGFPTFYFGMALSGIGLGTYLSVDLAFVTDVLPDKQNDAAKDLGVFNIASTLPQILGPIAATAVLALSRDSYAAVFAVIAVVGGLAAIVIVPVRSAR
ncbi:MAG TPA: MFS transporter [Steroidobacteraceae bacterium]|nr:MFS transporter [Steroidobacteraceae bacterium]